MGVSYLKLITKEFLNRLKDRYGSLTFCYHINKDLPSLVTALNHRFKNDFILKHFADVESSIHEFFEPLYTLEIKIREINELLHIDIKVTHGGDFDITSETQRVIKEIIELKNEILKIKVEKNLINIESDLKDKILNLVEKDKKNILKIAIKEALELDERDLVIFLHNKIVIKKFTLKGYERRFNGIPPEELNKMKLELFPNQGDIQKKFIKIVNKTLKNQLNLSKIAPANFMKNSIKIIQKEVFLFLDSELENIDKVLIEGFGNYIFRENYDLAFKIINKKLIELIMEKDANAMKFIQYFNGETDLDGNTRYQRPKITNEEGHKINALTIINIVSQHKNNLKALEVKEREIEQIESEIVLFNKEMGKSMEASQILEDDEGSLNRKIELLEKDSMRVNDLILATKNDIEQKAKLNHKLKEIKLNIDKLSNEFEPIKEKKKSIDIKIANINSRVQKRIKNLYDLNKKRENLLKSQKPISDRFEMFSLFLEKTLKKKRVKIS